MIQEFKETTRTIRQNAQEQTVSYLVAALSVVAGLAWNDAVKEFITYFFPNQANGLIAKFLYAVTVTFVVVVLTMIVRRALAKKKED